MEVRVSVIIAARNEELRIARCVESLLAAMGPMDEIVVINDGSTDATYDVVSKYESDRVRVISNPESVGRAASRNSGIRIARGKYIAIQDADDEALPGRIQIPLALLEADDRLVAASGQCIAVTDRGFHWRHTVYATSRESIRSSFERSTMAVCHTGSIIRRSALETTGLYDPAFVRAQDLELFKRLSSLGPIENSPLDVVLYTHNVWLEWTYWRTSRKHHDVIANRAPLPFVAQMVRYALAMVRREGKKYITHRDAVASLAVLEGPKN